VQHDVDEGRSRVNFSEWGQGIETGFEIAGVVSQGEMPPTIFLLMHKSARLSAQEKEALLAGLWATFRISVSLLE